MTTRLTELAISTTGNITGNIVAANVVRTDNYQYANGTPFSGGGGGSYGNTEVGNFLAAGLVGNIIPLGNAVYSLGNATNQWSNLWVANNTIYLGGVPIGITAGNVLTVNGNAVLQNNSNSSISTTGNITADYFIGDGSQLTNLPGGSGNTGNVTFDNQVIQGTGDQYGGGGLYLSPGTDSTGNLQYLRVRGGDYPTHIHFDTGNTAYYDQYFGDDGKYVKLEAGSSGNIVIGTNSNSMNWTFENTGNLNMPVNGKINVNNGEIVSAWNEDFTVTVQDEENDGWGLYNQVTDGYGATLARTRLQRDEFRVSVDVTGANYDWNFDNVGRLNLPGNIQGVYGGDTSFYAYDNGSGGSVELKTISYAGDALGSNIRVTQSNATISTNSAGYNWTFDNTGLLTLPGGNVVIGAQFGAQAIVSTNESFGVVAQGNASTVLQWSDDIANTSQLSAIYVNGPMGNVGDIQIRSGNVSSPNVWTFGGNDGNLSLPSEGNIVGITPNNVGHLQWVGNSSGDGSGYTTLRLVPDDSVEGGDQYLIIDPTGGGHIHIRAGGTQDNSAAELYMGGEKNFVRVVDNSGVRVQNEQTVQQTNNYYDPADFTNGQWYTMAGLYYIEYTSTNAQLDQDPYLDINYIYVTYNGGANNATLTYASATQNLGGGTYRVRVNEVPPAEPTVLAQISYTLNVTTTNYLQLEYNNLQAYVDDSATIQAKAGIQLTSQNNIDSIRITTDNLDDSWTWDFGANGVMSAPGSITTAAVSASGNVTGSVGFFNDVIVNNVTTNKILYANDNREIYDTVFSYDSGNSIMSGSGSISVTGNISAGNILIGGTPLTRSLTVGTRTTAVTVPLSTNNSFEVLTRASGNIAVPTT